MPLWGVALAWLIAGVVAATPALLTLRLRSPRPSLRRLSRQPGFVASLAGTVVLALSLLAIGILAMVRAVGGGPGGLAGRRSEPTWWLGVLVHFVPIVGPAVIGAWTLLAISGRRRRPRRNWLDGLGRLAGVVWIALFVIHCGLRLFELQG